MPRVPYSARPSEETIRDCYRRGLLLPPAGLGILLAGAGNSMNGNRSTPARVPGLPYGRWWLSLFMGMAFSLSIYNFFLVPLFPPTSRRMYILLPVLAFLGFIGYYFILARWMIPVLSGMKTTARWLAIASACLLGSFLLLAGTEAVKSSPGSIIIFLPSRSVEITADPQQASPNAEVVLLYFKTSTGAVPLSALQYVGWTQKGNQLVLTDFSNNSLHWTGRPGQVAAFYFQRSPQGGVVDVAWDNFTERVNLYFDRPDKYTYRHEFRVPFYASNTVIFVLAAANFIFLSLLLLLFLWSKREVLQPALSNSIRPGQRDEAAHTSGAAGKSRRTVLYQVLLIAGILIAALLLRVFNLNVPYIYIDELSHLVAAKGIISGSPLGAVYQRGLYLVTLPVALLIRLFGLNIWAAKLPGVIFNALAIIPLYLLVGRINRRAAILSCLLFASNPWMIGVSRSIREYAFYPFYFYWIAYFMVTFLEDVPRGLVIVRDWRKLVNRRNAGILFALLLPLVYANAIDRLSTFRTVLLLYPVFLVFFALKFDLRDRSNLVFILLAAIGLIVFVVLYQQHNAFIDFLPVLDTYPLRYFFPDPPQQWYFERLGILFALAFAASVSIGITLYRRNFAASFLAALFFVSILVFMLFFRRFFRPRYLINVQLWFIPILGLGFAMLWQIFQSIFPAKRWLSALLIVAVLAAGINIHQVWMPSTYFQSGVMPITDEYQYNFEQVEQFLLGESTPGDVLVGSLYGTYVDWRGVPDLDVYRIDLKFGQYAQTSVYKLVKQYDSGWIVLDDRYDRGEWPDSPFNRGNKRIKFIGSMNGQLVYKWFLRH